MCAMSEPMDPPASTSSESFLDEDFKHGLDHIDKAIALAPGGRLIVEDPGNGIHNADELRAELAAGLRVDEHDFNPMRIFRRRK